MHSTYAFIIAFDDVDNYVAQTFSTRQTHKREGNVVFS